MRVAAALSLFSTGVLALACSSSDGATTTTPSCGDLQTQMNACSSISQETKNSFATTCAGFSAECRSCLDGHLCGTTEQCDVKCGKASSILGQLGRQRE